MEWERLTELFSRHRGGIRQRLLIWGLALLGAALIINTLAGSLYTRRLIKREAAELQKEVASRVAQEIEDFIRRKLERLLDLSASASLHDLGGEVPRLLVLLMLKNDRSFTEMAVLDDKGMEVLKLSERRVYLPAELSDQSGSEIFKKAIKGENYVSPVYPSDKAEPYVTLAVPVKVTPQKVAGVVSAEANLKSLWEVIGDIEFGSAGYAYLVDGRGNLIAHRDPSLVLKGTNLSHLNQVQEFLRNPRGVDPSPAREHKGIMGKPVLSTFAPVRRLGWAIILEEPVDVALAEMRRTELYAFLLLGVGLLVGALIIVWVSNRITEPIRLLQRGVEIIGSGNLDHQVEVKTGDEMQELAQEFNEMAGELKTLYSTLEQKVEQRTKELSALYDVTATLSQSLDLDVVLREITPKVLEIIHFDAARIYLLDPEGKELRLRAYYGISPEFASQTATDQLGVGINGNVAATGEPAIFEDIQTDPQYASLAGGRLAQEAGFHAYISLPLKTKAKSLGVMNFLSYQVQELLPNEVALLTAMANQIGIAVENASLFAEVRNKSQQLSAINIISTTVSQSLELDVILNEAIGKVLEILRFDAGQIFLVDPSGQKLHLRAYKGSSVELSQVLPYRIGESIVGKVGETGEPLMFEDIQTDPRFLQEATRQVAIRAGFHANVHFPIKAKEKILGVMNLFSYTRHHFTPEEVELVFSMASQIGVAVENASLFAETVISAQRLSALNTVAATVTRSLNIEEIFYETANLIKDIMSVQLVTLFQADLAKGELLLKAHRGAPESYLRVLARARFEQTLAGQAILSGEQIYVEDFWTDPRGATTVLDKFRQEGPRSIVFTPLEVKRKVLGVLVIGHKEPKRFIPQDLEFLKSIADGVALAIENANLFGEVKNKTVELEKTNRDLREANQAKSDFLAAMSHELRTPLNVIIGNADLAKDGFFGDVNERQRDALEKIVRHSHMLLKLINDVLTLTRMDAKKMTLDVSTADLDEILAYVRAYVEQLNRDKNLQVSWKVEQKLPSITTDLFKLEEILQNLIGNAFKFTPKGSIEVRVRDLPEKDQIEFTVADTGIGIGESDLEKIFDQFHQLQEAHTGSYSGVGLGLNIVKKYLELMQGEIRVESQPGMGSTFTFVLPYSL